MPSVRSPEGTSKERSTSDTRGIATGTGTSVQADPALWKAVMELAPLVLISDAAAAAGWPMLALALWHHHKQQRQERETRSPKPTPSPLLSCAVQEGTDSMATPLRGYEVTYPYGRRGDYVAGYHTGDDYSTMSRTGIAVRATRSAVVVSIGNAWGSAYGLHVVLEGPRHRIRHGYAHLSRVLCSPGQHVDQGDVIGLSGASGRATGPHLHYEERHAPFTYWDHRKPRFNHE